MKNIHRFWTLKEVEYLKIAFQTMTEREIAKVMGLTIGQVEAAISRYKIRCGRDGRFQPGQIPANKGIYCRRSPGTEFRKGGLPYNTRHDGAISVRKDKTGITYQFIRVGLAKWRPLHRVNWEQVRGPIAPRMILTFKDKDTFNCDVSNLELITQAENMRRNYNRKKASAAMKELWRKEKLRHSYGMSPKSGIGKLINKRAA